MYVIFPPKDITHTKVSFWPAHYVYFICWSMVCHQIIGNMDVAVLKLLFIRVGGGGG